MEQVKKEASKFLCGAGGNRKVVDGVKVYTESELEKEMGELHSPVTHKASVTTLPSDVLALSCSYLDGLLV
jgi:hypothetical protein